MACVYHYNTGRVYGCLGCDLNAQREAENQRIAAMRATQHQQALEMYSQRQNEQMQMWNIRVSSSEGQPVYIGSSDSQVSTETMDDAIARISNKLIKDVRSKTRKKKLKLLLEV